MTDSIFDVSASVISRNRLRLIVKIISAIGLIGVGFYLQPDGVSYKIELEALESWNGWSFLGACLIVSGIYVFIGAVIFLMRSMKSTGAWHFRLDHEFLTWDVPKHSHGPEVGFRVPLSDIKEIEERYIQKDESPNETEYWVHFNDKPPIQLRYHSGFSLS